MRKNLIVLWSMLVLSTTAMAAGTQQQAIFQNVKQIGPLVFWASVLSPILIAGICNSVMIITWRRVNRATGNPAIKSDRVFYVTLLGGVITGAIAQWGMQEIITAITGVGIMAKMIVVAAVFTGPASILMYNLLRWQAKSRGWDGLYAFISVKHEKGVDYSAGDYSDMTVTKPPKCEDDGK